MQLRMTRDRVVGIATGYGLDEREAGVRVPVGWRILTFYPMGNGKCFHGGNAEARETDQSLLTSTELSKT
jgi:hypothetical protein